MTTEDINTIKERIAGDYKHLSSVSILRHMQDIVAIAVWHLQNLFALHKTEIDAQMERQYVHTLGWWRSQILAFQLGDDLTLVDYRPAYVMIDETAQIIKYCHCIDFDGKIQIKVAKDKRTELLSLAEKDALDVYINQIKYPGTKYQVINLLPDIVAMVVDVFIDKQTIDLDGKQIGGDAYPVKEGIIAKVNDTEFGGELIVTDLIAYILSINGVEDVVLHNLESAYDPGVGPLLHTFIYLLEDGINLGRHSAVSGHFTTDEVYLTINYF